MSNPTVTALVLKLVVATYAYQLAMASANVLSCELRRPGQCGNQWTQAFTVAGGAASTLWAFITESPSQAPRGRSRTTPPADPNG